MPHTNRGRRALAGLAVAAGLAGATAAPAAADPIELPEVVDQEPLRCTQLTPHVLGPERTPATLDVRVLLDGVDQGTAERAVAAMRKAYEPEAISVAATYEAVRFEGTDAAGLNAQAKAHHGGQRPAGTDVVYTLTSKDIAGPPPTGGNVAGLADCIGGVRFPDRAFAVGEVFPEDAQGGTVPLPVHDATGKTMAHEIGHLVGGHHHYSSPEGALAEDPNALSLMGPSLSVISLRFSSLNGLMARGHTQRYAG